MATKTKTKTKETEARLALLTEDVLAISEVADHLPLIKGKKTSLPTLYRWLEQGVKSRSSGKNVKLEFAKVGTVRLTSKQAVARFLEAIN